MTILPMAPKITVLGSGAWGTALALSLARNGRSVTLWAHSPEAAKEIVDAGENVQFLPGFKLPSADHCHRRSTPRSRRPTSSSPLLLRNSCVPRWRAWTASPYRPDHRQRHQGYRERHLYAYDPSYRGKHLWPVAADRRALRSQLCAGSSGRSADRRNGRLSTTPQLPRWFSGNSPRNPCASTRRPMLLASSWAGRSRT